jgi:phosphoglycolate phosphatase-like HAD superfamily hydrolase
VETARVQGIRITILNLDLVIFDCDGVLVDSEVISCRVHAEVLTRYGYKISAEQVRERFLGRSAQDANLEVERELGRPLPHSLRTRTALGANCRTRRFLRCDPAPYRCAGRHQRARVRGFERRA